jgi:cytochrome c oxidase subunit I+III
MTLIVVMAMIFLMLVFSYIYLWSQRPQMFPLGGDLAPMWLGITLYGVTIVLAVAARKIYESSPLAAAMLLVACAAAIAVAAGLDAAAVWNSGVRPQTDAYGALVFAFLSWQGVFVAVTTMMGLFLLARLAAGLLVRERPMTMERRRDFHDLQRCARGDRAACNSGISGTGLAGNWPGPRGIRSLT